MAYPSCCASAAARWGGESVIAEGAMATRRDRGYQTMRREDRAFASVVGYFNHQRSGQWKDINR